MAQVQDRATTSLKSGSEVAAAVAAGTPLARHMALGSMGVWIKIRLLETPSVSVGVCARVRGGALARGSSLQFGRCQRALRKMRASLNWRGLRPAAQQARLECIEKWPSFRVRMQIEPGTERRSGEGRREKADAHRFVHCAGLLLAAPRTSTRLFCELPCASFACTGPLFSMADTWLVMPSIRLEPAANDAWAAACSLTCSDGCRVRRRQ